MDDIEGNSTKMHTELNENPAKFRIRRTYLPQDNYLTDLSEELNQAIISCVEQHQMLIEFSKMMEDFFSVFVLLKSFQTTFQICNLVFTFLKVSQWNLIFCPVKLCRMRNKWTPNNFQIEGSVGQYFNLSQYLMLTLLDVFQLCYFGETLKTQSSHISDALLRCPWCLCGGPFRRILSIILSNSTQPLVMTGGKFFILDFYKLSSVSL